MTSDHKHGDSPKHVHSEHAHGDHAHSHTHSHAHHGHAHGPANYNKAFAIGIVLNTAFVIVEAFYGVMGNRMVVKGLCPMMAWAAAALAKRRPTERRTYGLRRTSILASLANALLLLVAVGGVVWEAVQRLGRPEPVVETTVIVVALIGIGINAATAMMFMSGRKGDINIQGAFMHMAADAAVSLGVVLAAVAMMYTGWLWLDPATSLVIAIVITIGTWSLLRESVNLALDAVPQGVDRQEVERFLAGQPGVAEVHDLHIWAMSTTEVALTVHLVRPGAEVDDGFLARMCRDLRERFGVQHATVQIESGDPRYPCHLAPADTV